MSLKDHITSVAVSKIVVANLAVICCVAGARAQVLPPPLFAVPVVASGGPSLFRAEVRPTVFAVGQAGASAKVEDDAPKRKPRWAKFASREGNLIFLSAAMLLPLATDGRQGTNRSLRTFDTLATVALLTEGLKRLTRERRPDGTTDTFSFPSGHASAAFAVATYRSRTHKGESLFWFAGAAAIAASRVALNRHRPRDVVAGAILGTATAAVQTRSRRGLVLSPIVGVDRDNRLSLGVGGSF